MESSRKAELRSLNWLPSVRPLLSYRCLLPITAFHSIHPQEIAHMLGITCPFGTHRPRFKYFTSPSSFDSKTCFFESHTCGSSEANQLSS